MYAREFVASHYCQERGFVRLTSHVWDRQIHEAGIFDIHNLRSESGYETPRFDVVGLLPVIGIRT